MTLRQLRQWIADCPELWIADCPELRDEPAEALAVIYRSLQHSLQALVPLRVLSQMAIGVGAMLLLAHAGRAACVQTGRAARVSARTVVVSYYRGSASSPTASGARYGTVCAGPRAWLGRTITLTSRSGSPHRLTMRIGDVCGVRGRIDLPERSFRRFVGPDWRRKGIVRAGLSVSRGRQIVSRGRQIVSRGRRHCHRQGRRHG